MARWKKAKLVTASASKPTDSIISSKSSKKKSDPKSSFVLKNIALGDKGQFRDFEDLDYAKTLQAGADDYHLHCDACGAEFSTRKNVRTRHVQSDSHKSAVKQPRQARIELEVVSAAQDAAERARLENAASAFFQYGRLL